MHLPKNVAFTDTRAGECWSCWAPARVVLEHEGAPDFQARAETGLTGASCTASCWEVTMKTDKFSASCWLAFVSELGEQVLEGTLHTGLSPDLPRYKAFLGVHVPAK